MKLVFDALDDMVTYLEDQLEANGLRTAIYSPSCEGASDSDSYLIWMLARLLAIRRCSADNELADRYLRVMGAEHVMSIFLYLVQHRPAPPKPVTREPVRPRAGTSVAA